MPHESSAAARALSIYEIAEMTILNLHQSRTSPNYRRAAAHLASAARVCRAWNIITTPILYSELEINDDMDFWRVGDEGEKNRHLVKLLAEDASKARLVRRLHVEGIEESAIKQFLPHCSALVELLLSLQSSDVQANFDAGPLLAFAEGACRSLTSLYLHLSYKDLSEWGWQVLMGGLINLQELLVADIFKINQLRSSSLPMAGTVTTLTLMTVRDGSEFFDPYDSVEVDRFVHSFRCLRHLSISGPLWSSMTASTPPPTLHTLELELEDLEIYLDIIEHLADATWLPNLTATPVLCVGYDMQSYIRFEVRQHESFGHDLPWRSHNEVAVLVDAARAGLRKRPAWREGGDGEAEFSRLLKELPDYGP